MDAVEVRGIGDTGDFARHGLVFGIDHQTLVGSVGAGGCLFGQFLHADQLFVDNAQGAVGCLDEGNGVVGVAHALVQGRDVGAHQFADGETGGIVSRAVHAQAAGKALGRGLKVAVMVGKGVRNVGSHLIVIDVHDIPP